MASVRDRLTGRAAYAADLRVEGMLHARPVLATCAAGRLRSVDAAAARRVPGVVAVLTAADLAGWSHPVNARVSAVLARDRVAFAGQPLAVVVGETEAAAADGAAAVVADVERLPVLASAAAALAPGAPPLWPEGLSARGFEGQLPSGADLLMDGRSNVCVRGRHRRGDAEAGLARADAVAAGTYACPAVHQGYLEPHAALAIPEAGGLTIHSATRGPFHVRAWVARLLGLPESAVRVVPAALGGAFGAKCGVVEPLAAAAALALGRPVRLALTRSEDMRTTTPGPAVTIELAVGATRRGVLTALRGRIVVDDGAFPLGLGEHVAEALGGAYRCPNVDLAWLDVVTNRQQGGPLRAPGGPQAAFALESAMDELARRLGRDPLELRLANAAGEGIAGCLERLRAHPLWRDRRPGTGAAAGVLAGLEARAGAEVRRRPNGGVEVRLGSVDVSGAHASVARVVAEALGVPAGRVSVVAGDTALVPPADVTGASRTTYASAAAVLAAVADLRRRGGSAGCGEVALPARPVAVAQLARVAVDGGTGAVRALDWVAVQDVGRAVGPPLVRGQVHGGVAQGLGMGLLEELAYDGEGRLLTATLGDYALPTAGDVPVPEVLLLERPGADPLGAGEPPVIPGPAAIANAVRDATGVRVTELPISPERLWRALRERGS